MISILQEFSSFESLINENLKPIQLIAEAKQQPTDRQAVFLVVGTDAEELNRTLVHRKRSYQLIFYAEDMYKAMELHAKVDALFTETGSLACEDRFIKMQDHSMSRVFKTDSGLHSFLCMVEASYTISRTFEVVPKMANVTSAFY
ncbi:hypothetical protein [Paenisporosarcina sp. NPDC076898]|uniref:hypothetical protein n=1 Tax=unclassified Paenisporosarcina TaxID=2642018 RepID=UPI003D016719